MYENNLEVEVAVTEKEIVPLKPGEKRCPICKVGIVKIKGEIYCKNSCRKRAHQMSRYYKIFTLGGL